MRAETKTEKGSSGRRLVPYGPLLAEEAELLKPHATRTQALYIDAILQHGNMRKASRALGVRVSSVSRSLQYLRRRVARIEPGLHAKRAPEGYPLRGVSTLLDADGNVVQTWVKTGRAADDPEAFAEAVRHAIRSLPSHATPIRAPERVAAGRLSVLPIGDPHFGMLSWPEETGQAWDLKIAAATHANAIARLFAKAPPAEEALVVWMGDNAHGDDSTNMTPRSGHILDIDSRWERMIGVLFTAMINSVDVALQRHERVTFRAVKGNHDPHVTPALALAVEAYYRNEPRVTVARQPTPLYVTTWGRNLLAFTHGHAPSPERVPDVLAADYRKEIGATEQGHLYTGHVHSKNLRERGGLGMESVRTLAARDSYATTAGFRAMRGIFLDTYDKRLLGATDRAMQAAVDVESGEAA